MKPIYILLDKIEETRINHEVTPNFLQGDQDLDPEVLRLLQDHASDGQEVLSKVWQRDSQEGEQLASECKFISLFFSVR